MKELSSVTSVVEGSLQGNLQSGAQASKKKEFSFAVRSRFPATQCWEICSQHVCVGTGARGISILAESQFDKETSALLKQAHKRQPRDTG